MPTSVQHLEPQPIDRIAILLAKAAEATPTRRIVLRKWTSLHPVFQALRERGFAGPAAIQWMIEQGAIPATDEKRAFQALHQITNRRARKKGVARA